MDIKAIENINNVIYVLENKFKNTQDFNKRKELKNNISNAIKDRDNMVKEWEKEQIQQEEKQKIEEKTTTETNERDSGIIQKIKSYL